MSKIRGTVQSFFIMWQMLRTSDSRDRMDIFLKAGPERARAFAERTGAPFIPDLSAMKKYLDGSAPLWHGAFITNIPALITLAQPLQDLIWFAAINESVMPFWTSDNPVFHFNEPHPTQYWDLSGEGTSIYLPISSRITLILRDKNYFPDELKKDRSTMQLSYDDVIQSNIHQLGRCSRQVYGSSADYTLASKSCVDHPEILVSDLEFLRKQLYFNEPDADDVL